MLRLLHAGCGRDPLPAWLGECDEVRLDIDPGVQPHVVSSMTNIGDVGEFDMIWCSHALEHLTPPDVHRALSEFHRVLKPGGCAVVIVPDLEDVKPTHDPVYQSPVGPISGHDMYYGYNEIENPHMQHRSGFIQHTLLAAIHKAGFSHSQTQRMKDYNLAGIGKK
jgi:predicted SAM-dependent methyltransferase